MITPSRIVAHHRLSLELNAREGHEADGHQPGQYESDAQPRRPIGTFE